MTREMIQEKVLAMVAEQLGESAIDPSADLQKNYAIDSIGVMDFIMNAEEEFSIQFEDSDLEQLKSVNDVVDRIMELRNA